MATRRENFNPGKYAHICSKHFAEEAIDRTSLSCVRIREDGVPSIFDAFPKHLQKRVVKRKPPAPRKNIISEALQEIPVNDATDSETANKENRCTNMPTVSPCEENLKRKLAQTELQLTAAKKKIKVLHQAKRCLKQKKC